MLAMDKSASAMVDDALCSLLALSLDPCSLVTLPGLSSWLNPLDFTGGNTRPGYPVVGTNLCSFRHEYLALEWVDVGVAREDLYLEGVGLEVPSGLAGEDRVEEVIEEDGSVEVGEKGGGSGAVNPPAPALMKECGGPLSPPSLPSPPLPPPNSSAHVATVPPLEAGVEDATPTAKLKPAPLTTPPAFSVPKPSFLPKGMLPWEGGKPSPPIGWGGGTSGSGGNGSGGGSGSGGGGGGGLRLNLVSPRTPRSTISVAVTGFTQPPSPSLSLEVAPPSHDTNTTPKGGGKAPHLSTSPPSPGMLMVRGFPLSLPPRERKRW
jgi:hypothetical protein